jgi:high-affinity iron transporter
MLDAVMLVLREVLEAALFVSLLLALGARLGLPWRWGRVAIPLGLLASWLASHFAYDVAAAFDGTGQEYLNALLYIVAVVSFIALNTLLVPSIRQGRSAPPLNRPAVYTLFILIVSSSMAREGSEVWIYLSAFVGVPAAMSAALMGGLIGTGIGLSLCALVYYAFSFLERQHFLVSFFVIATLVVGGLSMQLAKLGLQIGLLESRQPIWDTNAWISERSWFGQFLHALFGYDANPDTIQAVFYLTSLLTVAISAALQWQRTGNTRNG